MGNQLVQTENLPASSANVEKRSSSAVASKPAYSIRINKGAEVPNAALIYGIGAAALLGVAIYFLFTGMWLRGALVLLPCAALMGFMLHFIRNPV
ncbi:MAG: hypothetical protein PHX43_07050 [Alphaproteobacteria bacterium]|nr:hypothetical protein [Alphaproteobacteria bacterium]